MAKLFRCDGCERCVTDTVRDGVDFSDSELSGWFIGVAHKSSGIDPGAPKGGYDYCGPCYKYLLDAVNGAVRRALIDLQRKARDEDEEREKKDRVLPGIKIIS